MKNLKDLKDLNNSKTLWGNWAQPGEYFAHGLKYKGNEIHLLTEIVEADEDVTKMGHFLIDAKTKKPLLSIDWSPYSQPDYDDLKLFLELGCPFRTNLGPLSKQDLDHLKKKRDMVKAIESRTNDTTIEI
jgi:hypothetical protein